MSNDLEVLRADTLRTRVEGALRHAIMNGSFQPGARLVEKDLCEKLGVSRTSVREALRKLEAEKLVHIIPHKGPVVASMTPAEAAELYALRGLLEGFAAREFARLADSEAIASFGAAVKELREQALVQNNKEGVLRAKTALYDVLLNNCGNALVKDVLVSLYTRINLLRTTSLMHPDRLLVSLREIDKLHKMIKARNGEGAEQAARVHVANACEAALRVLATTDAPAHGA